MAEEARENIHILLAEAEDCDRSDMKRYPKPYGSFAYSSNLYWGIALQEFIEKIGL